MLRLGSSYPCCTRLRDIVEIGVVRGIVLIVSLGKNAMIDYNQ